MYLTIGQLLFMYVNPLGFCTQKYNITILFWLRHNPCYKQSHTKKMSANGYLIDVYLMNMILMS